MDNTLINLNEVLDSVLGFAITKEEYLKLSSGLSVRAQRVLDMFHRQSLDEKDYYKELLLFQNDQLHNLNGCGRITANELLVFQHDFKVNVGRRWLVNKGGSSMSTAWPIFYDGEVKNANQPEFTFLMDSNLKVDRLISELTCELSKHSKSPARRFLKRFNGDWGKLYAKITSKSFSVYSIYGVGRTNGPEIEQWLEKVKNIIQYKKDIAPPVKQSANNLCVSVGETPTICDIDRLLGNKLEAEDERRIKDMTSRLSTRSRTVVDRLIKQAGWNLGTLYRRLSDDHFSVQKLDGVGIKSVLEMYKWTEDIKEIIRPYYVAQRHNLKEPIRFPDQYHDVFNLDGFLNDINKKIDEYRTEEEYIHIRDFIYPNCNGVYKEALFAEIETVCVGLIGQHYTIAIIDRLLVFPRSNSEEFHVTGQ